jgi:hypothetical protein
VGRRVHVLKFGTALSTAASTKPAFRLDDLIPTEKVMNGRRVTFGVRTKPVSKSQP